MGDDMCNAASASGARHPDLMLIRRQSFGEVLNANSMVRLETGRIQIVRHDHAATTC